MKRRTFIKGLGIALLAPTMLLTKEAKAEVPSSNYRPMPGGMKARKGLDYMTATEVKERQDAFTSRFISEVKVLKGGGGAVRHRQNDMINEALKDIGRI